MFECAHIAVKELTGYTYLVSPEELGQMTLSFMRLFILAGYIKYVFNRSEA